MRFRRLQSLATLLASGIVFALYFLFIGLILAEFGLSLTAYLASASVLGLAIGFGSQLAFKGLGFVTLALMARNLSQADYGKLMFALTLCGVTVLATDLGASTDLVRRVAADPAGARRRLGRVLSARGPLVAAYLALICAWAALTKPDALAVVAAIAVYSVLKDLYRSYASLFLGLHRVEYSVAAYGTKLVFLVVAVAVGAAVDGGLAWMTGAHVASGVVLLVTAALIARAQVGPVRLRPPGSGHSTFVEVSPSTTRTSGSGGASVSNSNTANSSDSPTRS